MCCKEKKVVPVLKLSMETEFGKLTHSYNDWNFSENEPDTIHAYLDAIVILLRTATFSEKTIEVGFRQWLLEGREE